MFITLLVIDLVCLITVLVFSKQRLSFGHPLTLYLFFHAYSFTFRALQIYLGAPTMYSTSFSAKYEAITENEITQALVYADIGLIGMAIGSHLAHKRVKLMAAQGKLGFYRPLEPGIVWPTAILSFVIGSVTWYLARFSDSGINTGGFANYLAISTTWTITSLSIVFFITQQLFILMPLILVYLGTASLQGYHRFMTVLPVLTIVNISVTNSLRRWPSLKAWSVLLILYLLFPYMKPLGRSFLDKDFEAFKSFVSYAITPENITSVEEKGDGFLDQFAGFVTLVDRSGKLEYGGSYIALFTLPIPRNWWPEKPGLADYIHKRATPSRPYDVEGRVITYLGQAYVDFGILGIIFVPVLFGFMSSFYFERSLLAPVQSTAVLAQMFLIPSLLLAYRDGIVSLFLYGMVFNMPMIFVWLSHQLIVQGRPISGYRR